ncbi:MAG: OmpA family protein [Bacteroidota bacterium]
MINRINLKIVFSIFVILLAFIQICNAQNVEFEKKNFPDKKDEYKNAVRAIKDGDYFFAQAGAKYKEALNKYQIAQSLNPNNAELNYKIGKCIINGREKNKSLDYFKKAYELNSKYAEDLPYLLGCACQLNYKWDDAIKYFNEYKLKGTPKEDVDKRLSECETGKTLEKTPIRVFIDNLGQVVNSPYNEYAPVISADQSVLIFTSRRPGTTGDEKDPRDFDFYEDIYIAKNENDQWQAPVNPGSPLNTKSHDAVVGLSNDGQKLLTYRGQDNGGDIYISNLKGDQWSNPDALNNNINSKYQEPSASLSPDGKTLYFTSRREGGFGDLDVYKSTQNEKGKWQKPENLGPIINTKYDEDAVFIHPDGKTLYFSSRGHKTMGGFDIFKSVYENGKWSEPENLGFPINTPDNDAYFVLAANGINGYYSSARDGGLGGQDIYMITFLGEEKQVVNNSEDNLIASITAPISATVVEAKLEVKSQQLTMLKGIITDATTKAPLNASIELVDNNLNEVLATFESNSKSGKYLVSLPAGRNYGIVVKAQGYLFHSENFDIAATDGYSEVVKDIALNKVDVGSKIVLKNIFFDFGKATLRTESTVELDNLANLLKEYSTLKIEISGFTDNKGADAYNLTLSEDRAKAVVDYLVSKKGIDKTRLTAKGYGKSQPIATNDTEEGRQQNRRTEFKILSK